MLFMDAHYFKIPGKMFNKQNTKKSINQFPNLVVTLLCNMFIVILHNAKKITTVILDSFLIYIFQSDVLIFRPDCLALHHPSAFFFFFPKENLLSNF